ncbi:MAG: FkbM family methyltransferase [Candidatus Omnitrophica bacterium]|nr:FkbM family methyltransferase [Candidatus Omnitrophota bacterium]
MKEKIIKAISWLVNNPLLFFMHSIVQARKLIPLPSSPVKKAINGVVFEFDFSYDPAIKSMYIGGYELDTVQALKKYIKKGDTVIDAGANIGYLSANIAGFVGKTGQVHSFEPVPQYFARSKKLSMMNPEYKILVNQSALGDREGIVNIKVTSQRNIGFNTIVPGSMSNEKKIKEILQVPIGRLDDYIKEKSLDNISLIKIDVEGYEFPVLKGLSGYLDNAKRYPVIICEIVPSVYALMGHKLGELSEYMQKYTYDAYSLINHNKKIDISKLRRISEVVFIPAR